MRDSTKVSTSYTYSDWYWPYPYGDSLGRASGIEVPGDRSGWLAPSEFFDLLVQLPPLEPSGARSDQLEMRAPD